MGKIEVAYFDDDERLGYWGETSSFWIGIVMLAVAIIIGYKIVTMPHWYPWLRWTVAIVAAFLVFSFESFMTETGIDNCLVIPGIAAWWNDRRPFCNRGGRREGWSLLVSLISMVILLVCIELINHWLLWPLLVFLVFVTIPISALLLERWD